ncbi:hypothetical protein [Ornithobacterium rhinotracheale]|uniref:Uracil-DNA glycosylase n=1 Tax=Ornithobacterium rhinotracheale (strain ATCC 51463 / DSM 15997 / CCUG 23171 / CIP 104009 / LMG 9086) TaxID=867902 RepID=I3ZZY7_ORNRL|nr:hypothetical protein [Ornithobacterium rhinotracheale]AFL97271.1 hypothetical protein Ornrh_1080 [Ornithobacterium rhinotracheale DSM 15997]AIQ00513.1 hypothetical protein Q785_06005 [Ornithobacterium rhinotracheale ORT-UMN 88]KGB66625.1 hypothetical protein Q787_06160 [Ornithobacterium rhinotracheale H06-030791]MBN3662437.1 hypothetical protein [Ornithobacterium rhinotracheale]MCK0194163.1 hypothetical protein [Ornithobacterium rhinotracheale]
MSEIKMDTSYDNAFKNIEGLRWLPFVGEKYNVSKPKVLLVGESHYLDESENNNHEKVIYTRMIANELGAGNRNYKTKSPIFNNVNNMLKATNPQKLWDKIAFYNFVQRPMSSLDIRPSNSDFDEAWVVFFRLVQVLKPDYCLFLGNSAAERLDKMTQKCNVERKLAWDEVNLINGAKFKKAELKLGNLQTKLFCIKHPSSHFSPELWREKLQKESPELMKFLLG